MGRKTAALGLLVALGIVACDSSTAPTTSEADAAPQTALMSKANSIESLQARNQQLGIQRAEFGEGFCFVAALDSQGGFGGFTGESRIVMTPSGKENYICKGDLLFGELYRVVNARGATLFNDFLLGQQEDCHIVATPGPNGQLSVNCNR
ncbi:MAG: hypothetical protein M8865_06585 [marine benthic group bacterium]|nr:hypothetical protein [Gemmatimonadota bacterium]